MSLTFLFLAAFSAPSFETQKAGGTEGPKPPLPATRETASAPENGAFPLSFNREHRYTWIMRRRKVGETKMRLTEVEEPGEGRKLFRSLSEYRYEREGTSLKGEHEAYFDSSWKPLRYKSRLQYSGLQNFRSRQDHEAEVRDGKLHLVVIHNQESHLPVRSEMEAPPEGYLFSNQAFDQWAILVGNLLHRPSTYDVKVIYPDLVRVYEVRFTFEKEEPVDLGRPEKPLCRLFSFRSKENQLEGRVWVDSRGKLVQHQQGELRIYLEE